MKYRHDLGNDRWIVEHVFPGLRHGYFIEAGATNGLNGSGTFVLESELGWSGLCIEAIPKQFEQIMRFRNCSADNRALWHTSGERLEFTIFPNRTGHSGLSAANKNIARADFQEETKELVIASTVTLSDVLRDHNAAPIIDYFCLDIEGSEFPVLSAFDFQGEYLIRSFSIEGHACDELMKQNGYRQVKNPFTDVDFETYWLHSSVELADG